MTATKAPKKKPAKEISDAPKGFRNFHGICNVPENWQDHLAWLWLFGTAKDGEKKLQYWKEWVTEMWPEPLFVWDDWSDLFFGAACGAVETVERVSGKRLEAGIWKEELIATGCASSGKSSRAAMWILGNWLCAQVGTSVILTSTSLDQLKRRIWAELCDWIGKAKHKMPLKIVASDTEIRVRDGDKRNCIFGIAVKSGGVPQEAVDRIKGIHNRRVFVVVDEMTAVPTAIVQACGNLNKGTVEYQFIGLGNALPGENPHTVHAEPQAGWNSVSVDDDIWLTKKGGVCIHFDGHKSPALKDPQRFCFYIKRSELDRDKATFGGENTPEYWTNDRGFWPPSGLSNTVMDLAFLNQFRVDEGVTWKGGYEMGGALDPAFEGMDRRILYPFKFGEFANGLWGLEYQKPIIVPIDVSVDKRWIHYAIADSVQNLCENYECDGRGQPIKPDNFIQDVTGEGGGLFSVMSGRWSPKIQPVEFGGAAEKEQVHPDRPTTYNELYANKVTMLWYVFRRFAEGGQIKGITDPDTRTELAGREKKIKNGKTAVVPKSEMRLLKRSCDFADAAIIGAEFLRRRGIEYAGTTGAVKSVNLQEWNKFAFSRAQEDELGYAEGF
jgi:hypothetical protein